MTPYLNKLINTYGNRINFIYYKGEFGGNVLHRIVCSDDKYYWSEPTPPLAYPDLTEGYSYQTNHFLSFKEQHLACVHGPDPAYEIGFSKKDMTNHLYALSSGLRLCIKSHNIKDNQIIKQCKGVKLYGSSMRRFYQEDYVEPSLESNILNINASKLLSKNYDDFLAEYIKLVQYFDLTPRVNSVRAFILLWLEKQERFHLTLS